jgi:glycosyltransferase involved in cell wall biosynthesis
MDSFEVIAGKSKAFEKFHLLSVCTVFPTRNNPTFGLFVKRRLEAIAKHVPVRILNPQPCFPFLRPQVEDSQLSNDRNAVDIRPMFYIPKVANHWNGFWLERCVSKWLSNMPAQDLRNSVLDAHFGYPEGVGCYRAARKHQLPLFITVRGLETELMTVPSIKRQMLEAFDYATGIISVSDFLKEMLVANGVPSEKVTVIGNGVDSVVYSPGDKELSRRLIGIEPETRLIVAVGNVQRRKGYDVLIDALKTFDDTKNLVCSIIGGVNEKETLEQLKAQVSDLGSPTQVRFLGQQTPDVVAEWLRAADVFVLPTRREGCCNAVLEALSSGTPVISTPAGDNTKFVEDYRNGFIVPFEDSASLASAITKSLDLAWDSKLISDSVREHTWDGAAGKVIEYVGARLAQ